MRIERRRFIAAAAALAIVPSVGAESLLDELATDVANDRADSVRRLLARKLFGSGNGFVYQGNGSKS